MVPATIGGRVNLRFSLAAERRVCGQFDSRARVAQPSGLDRRGRAADARAHRYRAQFKSAGSDAEKRAADRSSEHRDSSRELSPRLGAGQVAASCWRTRGSLRADYSARLRRSLSQKAATLLL